MAAVAHPYHRQRKSKTIYSAGKLAKGQSPNFPTRVNPTISIVTQPQTFTDSLVQIKQAKGKYRDSLYQLMSEVYAACRIGFSGNTEAEREENMKVLDKACAEQNIDGHSYYQKLGKLGLGDDTKQVSSIIHVIKVAEKNDVTPFNFTPWLKGKGGIQAIRSTYRSDGTLKPVKEKDESKDSSKSSTPAAIEDDQTFIAKAKTALTERIEATIPKGQLQIIEKIGNEAECTAILRQCADGSFVIKAVLADQKLVDSLYAAHGRALPAD
jgi:hypothetical protein